MPCFCSSRLYYTASQTGFKWGQNVYWHEEGKWSSSLFPCLRWLINNGLEVDRREVIFRLSKQSNFSPRNLLCGSCLSHWDLVLCITRKKILKRLFLSCLFNLFNLGPKEPRDNNEGSLHPLFRWTSSRKSCHFFWCDSRPYTNVNHLCLLFRRKKMNHQPLYLGFSNQTYSLGLPLDVSRLLVESAHILKLSIKYTYIYYYHLSICILPNTILFV